MPVYTGAQIVQHNRIGHASKARATWLTPLHNLTRRAPGCTLTITGIVDQNGHSLADFSIVIVSPSGTTAAQLMSSDVGCYRHPLADDAMVLAAQKLFCLENEVNVACDDYSVFGHASYFIGNDTIDWQAHTLFSDHSFDYYPPP